MTSVLSYLPDMQFDSLVDTVPSSSDDASTESLGSPIHYNPFPDTFLNDLHMPPAPGLDLDFDFEFQVPNLSYQQPLSYPYHAVPVKLECGTQALQEGVLASLEALKATDAHKGYATKQHTPVKKMKSDVCKPEEERVVRRRTKNREAAQASRLRKRVKLETLEGLVAEQKAITHAIMSERDNMMRENASLRHEVEYLKQALRVSMEGLKGLEADQLFSQVELGL